MNNFFNCISGKKEVMREAYVKNIKNIEYHVDDFKNGKTNILFVTGLSGSGKTTVSKKICDETGAKFASLDDVCRYTSFNDSQMDKIPLLYRDLAYEWSIAGEGAKIRHDHCIMGFDASPKAIIELVQKFVNYCISISSNTKIVIEGVQVYECVPLQTICKYSAIVLGTSILKSLIRSTNRDKKFHYVMQNFKSFEDWYNDADKQLDILRGKITTESTSIVMEANDEDDGTDYTESVDGEKQEEKVEQDSESTEDSSDDDEPEGTDYTDSVEHNEEEVPQDIETEEDDSDDSGDTDSNDMTEDVSDSDTEDDSVDSDDTDSDEDGEQGTDYTDGVGDDSNDTSEDTAGDTEDDTINNTQTEQDTSQTRLNSKLFDDMETLLDEIKKIIINIDSIPKNSQISNKCYSLVSKNLTKVSDNIYIYLVTTFNKKSYAENLYQYNLFITALKVNIDFIKKISTLASNN